MVTVKYQDILNRKNFIIANQPHIVRPAAADLQNFKTDMIAPLKECKVHFSPVQDLHGYSNPWPAGGGKNIAKPYDNSYISSTYISFDYSAANGTFRCYGTASASSTHSSPSATNAVNNGATFTLPAGTYTLSIIDGDGADIYAQCVSSDETVLAETTSYTTFTTNESLTVFVRLKVAAAATVDKTVKIQLESGSSATSYVPYENVCPISGWTGIEVMRSPKNIFPKSLPEQLVKGSWSTGSTSISAATNARCFSIYIGTNRTLKFTKTGALTMELAFTDSPILDRSNTLYGAVNCTNRSSYTFNSNEHPYLGISIASVSHWDTFEERECILRFNETPEGFEARVDWEPITIDWTDTVGTIYGGYVDLVTGEVVQTCYNMLVDGNTAIYRANLTHGVLRVIYQLPYTGANKNALMCNQFGLRVRNSAMANYPIKGLIALGDYNAATTTLQIGAPDGITTQAEWESWLTDNSPIQVIYELAEPIVYPIDPITLKTLRGTNNIWSNANGNIDLAYWSH